MNFELEHQFRLESARSLPFLPEGHPCRKIHGHSFLVTLKLRGPRNPEVGWVMDFHEISKIAQPLFSQLDHSLLNETPGLENPTSENLCVYIFENLKPLLPLLAQIEIRESAVTCCRYPADAPFAP